MDLALLTTLRSSEIIQAPRVLNHAIIAAVAELQHHQRPCLRKAGRHAQVLYIGGHWNQILDRKLGLIHVIWSTIAGKNGDQVPLEQGSARTRPGLEAKASLIA